MIDYTHFPFVKEAQTFPVEVDGPDTIEDFLETDTFVYERGTAPDSPVMPSEAAISTDNTHLEMVGVFDGGDLPRQLA